MKLPSKNDQVIGKKPAAGKQAEAGQTKKKLTKQVAKFVDEMANPNTKSATEAAINAGSPPKSARVTASRWLTNANIVEAIDERKREAAKHSNVSPEAVIGAAVRSTFASIDDALDDEGKFDINKARQTGAIHLVKKITRTPTQFGETIAVEFHSSADARKELSDYLGLKQMPRENDFNLRLAVQSVLIAHLVDVIKQERTGTGAIEPIEVYAQAYIDSEPIETRAKLAEHKPRLLAGVRQIISSAGIEQSE